MKNFTKILVSICAVALFGQAQAQCDAQFSFFTNGGGAFTFTDSSGGRYTSETWSFGDGSTSNSAGRVSHTYQRTGTYTVCRIVRDSTRPCTDTFCTTITYSAGSSCKAIINYSTVGDTFNFRDVSTNSTYSYWSFGDGNFSSAKNPTHIYQRSGTYNVCLTITDSSRTCTDSTCLTVRVNSKGSKCDASFTGGSQNLTAYFRQMGQNSSTATYLWTFGNGDTSISPNPVYTYSKPGGYVVCLTVTDTVNNCTDRRCDSIVVDTTVRCYGAFTPSVNKLTVSFQNQSVNMTRFGWDFGDGNSDTVKSPTHTYAKPGTYTVCLYAYSNVCGDTVCMKVTVDSSNCRAGFRLALDSSQKFKMYLLNTSSGRNRGSVTYSWSFGDGGTSTQRNPTHKYKSFGKYNVCLTIVDTSDNCTSTYCDSIGMDSTGKMLKADGFTLQVIDDFSSVDQTEMLEAKIYPNPTDGYLNVVLGGIVGEASVDVYDLRGNRVSQMSMLEGNSTRIDLNDLPAGIYVVTVKSDNAVSHQRIIKTNK